MCFYYHIFDFTCVLVPHAEHFIIAKSASFRMSVSGLPHFGHSTNSFAYCLIFSFILEAGTLLPIITLSFLISPGVASSLRAYLRRCSGGLRSVVAICMKLVSIVLLPSRCPVSFGISNLCLSNTSFGIFFLALSSNCSYSMSLFIPCLFINLVA